jgi:hypothetical protein
MTSLCEKLFWWITGFLAVAIWIAMDATWQGCPPGDSKCIMRRATRWHYLGIAYVLTWLFAHACRNAWVTAIEELEKRESASKKRD